MKQCWHGFDNGSVACPASITYTSQLHSHPTTQKLVSYFFVAVCYPRSLKLETWSCLFQLMNECSAFSCSHNLIYFILLNSAFSANWKEIFIPVINFLGSYNLLFSFYWNLIENGLNILIASGIFNLEIFLFVRHSTLLFSLLLCVSAVLLPEWLCLRGQPVTDIISYSAKCLVMI